MKKILLSLLLLLSLAPAHASRSFVRTSGQYLNDETELANLPFTVSLWFRASTVADSQVLFSITALSDNGRAHYLILRGATDDTLNADTQGDSVFDEAKSSGTISAGVWTHCAGVWASSSSRNVFLNGTKNTNTTTAAIAGNMRRTSIGRVWFNATAAPADGLIAEVGLWNVALTDDEIASLAKGLSPLKVRPQNLVDYWPLYGNTTNEAGAKGNVMTNSSTTHSNEHPRIYK